MAKKKPNKPADNRVIPPGHSPRSGTAPPKEHQFQPGNNANPFGRPPNELSLTASMKELYACEVSDAEQAQMEAANAIPEKWKGKRLTKLQYLTIRNEKKAANIKFGDNMAKETWDRFDGKVAIRLAGPEGGPIEFKYDYSKLSIEELKQIEKLEMEKQAIVAKARINKENQ